MVAKIPPADYFPAAVTCRSHLGKTINNIKEKLTSTQLAMFRQTCFGPLLDTSIIFNGQLIHYFLLREVNESRPDVISFDILGKKVSFSQREFDLITGLRHRRRHVKSDVRSTRLKTKYLKCDKTMKGNELDNLFPSIKFENDEDAVKVALFYFIELVMMGRERTRLIDISLLGIIDDWELFCNENWSRMIFEKTLKGLQNATKRKVALFKERTYKNPERYSLYGFPYAFQVSSHKCFLKFSPSLHYICYSHQKTVFCFLIKVWAYETVSSLTGRIVSRQNDHAIPRILRWSCSHSPSYDVLCREMFGLSAVCFIPK